MLLRTGSSLTDLHVICEVARTRNFSTAARSLGLPPSSISRRIAAVEQRLGVTLFKRTTREVSLTPAGAGYCAQITRLLAELEQAERKVSRGTSMAEGTLVIETRPGISAWLLAPILPGFLEAYPQIRIDLRVVNDPIDALSRDTDLALRYGLPPPSSLVARKITSTRQRIYAAPSYLRRFGNPATPEDLDRHNCLGFSTNTRAPQWQFRAKGYERQMRANGNLRSNDPSTLRSVIQGGLGIGLAHTWIMQDLVQRGEVVELLAEYDVSNSETHDMNVSALYAPTMKSVEKLRVFLSYLQSRHQAERSPG